MAVLRLAVGLGVLGLGRLAVAGLLAVRLGLAVLRLRLTVRLAVGPLAVRGLLLPRGGPGLLGLDWEGAGCVLRAVLRSVGVRAVRWLSHAAPMCCVSRIVPAQEGCPGQARQRWLFLTLPVSFWLPGP